MQSDTLSLLFLRIPPCYHTKTGLRPPDDPTSRRTVGIEKATKNPSIGKTEPMAQMLFAAQPGPPNHISFHHRISVYEIWGHVDSKTQSSPSERPILHLGSAMRQELASFLPPGSLLGYTSCSNLPQTTCSADPCHTPPPLISHSATVVDIIYCGFAVKGSAKISTFLTLLPLPIALIALASSHSTSCYCIMFSCIGSRITEGTTMANKAIPCFKRRITASGGISSSKVEIGSFLVVVGWSACGGTEVSIRNPADGLGDAR